MVLQSGDIIAYESAMTGSAGGLITLTTITSGLINNLFPDITDGERLTGGTLYRKMFWKNNNTTDEMLLPVFWAPDLPDNMALSLGLGFNVTEDDDAIQGNMSPLSSNSVIALVSDGLDSRAVTIYGLDADSNPTVEIVEMTDDDEVVGLQTFSKVWAVHAEAVDAARTIEVRKGAAGEVLGSIPPNVVSCWLWVANPDAKAEGIALPDLAPGDSYGMWLRLSWSAAIDPVRPNNMTFVIEEA